MDATTQAKRKDRGSDDEDDAVRRSRVKTSHTELVLTPPELAVESPKTSSDGDAIGMVPTSTATKLPQDGSEGSAIEMAPTPTSIALPNDNSEEDEDEVPVAVAVTVAQEKNDVGEDNGDGENDQNVETDNSPQEKPLARGIPPVFALTRSALAEATDYFKSHESGNYHTDCMTLGLLLDRFETPKKSKKAGEGKAKFSARDYMDGSVIITTVWVSSVSYPILTLSSPLAIEVQ
jgi:hypothetical protein